MSFDRMGRRVTKNAQRFVYNGYLQIADNADNAYVWDPTEPVATRPLVWRRSALGTQHSALFYAFDGNKNVTEVLAADGSLAAHYEHAPFGAVTVSRGTSAEANPFRFSSEYAEDDTATVYYNYRHYEPVMGRWLGRDPMEGKGPYKFCSNYSGMSNDYLGLLADRYGDEHYQIDPKKCEMTVSMKVRFVLKRGDEGEWSESATSNWRNNAEKIVNKYFNGGYLKYKPDYQDGKFRCKSECAKKCKEGISVKFLFSASFGQTGDYDYDFTLDVFNTRSLRAGVCSHRTKDCIKQIEDEIRKVLPDIEPGFIASGNLSVDDILKRGMSGYQQIVLLHEIGHLLGMNHPGQTEENLLGEKIKENDQEDYTANSASLMGLGMRLVDTDFNHAFCNHIPEERFGKDWKAKDGSK